MNQEISVFTKKRKEIVDCRYFARNEEILYEEIFHFKAGRSYGILCEEGEGGGALSLLLSGRVKIIDEKICIFGHEYEKGQMVNEGWFVGEGFPGLNKSVKMELERALKSSNNTLSEKEVIEEFGLTVDRMCLPINKYSGESWRASAAIGYANKKKIFCYPWLDSVYLQHVLFTAYFFYVNKLKQKGCTIIIPAGNKRILEQMTDEVIQLHNPEYKDLSQLMKYITTKRYQV